MAISGRTPHANLPQWVGTDKPEMGDFNEAFANIDAELQNRLELKPRAINMQAAGTGWTPQLKMFDAGENLRFVIYLDGTAKKTGIYPNYFGADWDSRLYLHNVNSGIYVWNAGDHAHPTKDNYFDIGSASMRMRNLYLASGAINTSDARKKKDIQSLDGQAAAAFLEELRPVSYRCTDGQSGRTHYGLVAQEVEEAMEKVGLTDKDFAGLIKSPVEDEEGKPTGDVTYGLRYDEMIPLLMKVVQEQQKSIAELKKSIAEIQN